MTTMTYAPTVPAATVAQQQFAPYGLFGDILGAVAPIAGQAVTGLTGNSQIGAGIGGVGQILSGLLPFSATPGGPTPAPFATTQQTHQQLATAQLATAQLAQAQQAHAVALAQLARAVQAVQATQAAVNQAVAIHAVSRGTLQPAGLFGDMTFAANPIMQNAIHPTALMGIPGVPGITGIVN
jgi:hypothetical protein